MSFNPLRALWRRRIVRAGVGLLVLVGAAYAQYRLANVPLPMNVETIENFSPATIKLGQQELVIEGPVVNSAERMLFSHDGKQNETVDVSFDRARLDEQTVLMFESLGLKPLSTPARIDYRAQETQKPPVGEESCRTRVELRAASQMPAEIHLFQLGDAGLERYRHLEMRAVGAELVSNLLTESPGGSDLVPGCQKLLRVGDWNQSLTTIGVTTVVADNSALRFSFRPLTTTETLWGDATGFYEPFDLGAKKLNPNDPPPFQARAVSIRPLGGGNSTSAPPPEMASVRSTSDGPPLTIYGLKVGSDQLQLSIAGKGWVQINGEDKTVNFLQRVEENPIPSALLLAANTALIAWVARLIFQSLSSSPEPDDTKGRSSRSQRRRKGKTKKQTHD
jgi:hypothetical protein